MAQGNIIQGQASGKLGDTVLMVRNGTQVSRVYTTSGARSGDTASLAARLQRVRFGAASNEWQLYRYICTRMFRKGRTTNQSDYNYFVKRNVDNLPYLTKLQNADGVCCLMPGQFSEGNLGRIELLYILGHSTSSQRSFVQLADTINPTSSSLNWSATMAQLKSALQAVYPNARKLTYLFVLTSTNEITEGGDTFTSQFYQHHAVTIDLYAESRSGENAKTIAEYFSESVSNHILSDLLAAQTSVFFQAGRSIIVRANEAADDAVVDSLGLLLFATDDLVSDCYTTILPASAVPTTTGVYKIWGDYRTQSALQIAADSYGYQSGVMRDEVASSDERDLEAVAAYTGRLKVLDRDAAKEYAESLTEVSEHLSEVAKAVIEAE